MPPWQLPMTARRSMVNRGLARLGHPRHTSVAAADGARPSLISARVHHTRHLAIFAARDGRTVRPSRDQRDRATPAHQAARLADGVRCAHRHQAKSMRRTGQASDMSKSPHMMDRSLPVPTVPEPSCPRWPQSTATRSLPDWLASGSPRVDIQASSVGRPRPCSGMHDGRCSGAGQGSTVSQYSCASVCSASDGRPKRYPVACSKSPFFAQLTKRAEPFMSPSDRGYRRI